jgi:hypothetical protein
MRYAFIVFSSSFTGIFTTLRCEEQDSMTLRTQLNKDKRSSEYGTPQASKYG